MDLKSYLEKRRPEILGLGFREEAFGSLCEYAELLWQSNKELNLFSRKMGFEELVDNHIIDCLLPLPHLPSDIKSAADLGTGGGLPGVIYALQFPGTSFHLFEKSVKKRQFLSRCQGIATNLQLHEEISEDLLGVEVAAARAFKPLATILQMTTAFYQRGGHYYLLKARAPKIDEEIEEARKIFPELRIQIIPLQSPVLDVERHLVQVQRQKE